MQKIHPPPGTDLTLSNGTVYLHSTVIMIFIAVSFSSAYGLLWGWDRLASDVAVLYRQPFLSLAVLIIGAVLHETLHVMLWAFAAKLPAGSFEFGFNAGGLAPYAHCKAPMGIVAYRWGTAVPGLIQGILPFAGALLTGNAYLMTYGFMFALMASSDFLMLWKVRQLGSNIQVQDHPDRVGCEVVERI